jgi:tetratricopeptide (TPR) repeat protein
MYRVVRLNSVRRIVLLVAVTPAGVLPVACQRSPVPPAPLPEAGPAEPAPTVRGPVFADVTAGSGLAFTYQNGEEADHHSILESLGGGVALIDYDRDGLLDVFVTGGGFFAGQDKKDIRGHPNRLFKNLGNMKFRDVTAEIGLPTDGPFYSHGAAVGDYDNDGWPDLLVTGYGRLALYRNDHGRFVDVWQDAQAALEADDLPAAASRLRQYGTHRPGDGEGRLALARTLRRLGEYDEAEEHRMAAESRGADPEAVRREGLLARLQRRGVREWPTAELAALAGERRRDRAVLEALYRGDLAAREWDRAGFWLHWWLEEYPDDWPPRLWQAELLERFGRYDRARSDYLMVLDLRPDQPRAQLGVGRVALANRGNYAVAEAHFRRYLERDPGHAEARLGLARCRYARGDLAAAREGALGVLADHPEHAGAALLLGTLEAEAGREEAAADRL